jgi:hypothetical protein
LLLAGLTAACPEMTSLAALISSFAVLLRPGPDDETGLKDWIQAARACDLPVIHSFIRGLALDPQAVTAAVTLPFHNGRTEGVNTRTKMIKRQMYGRAGFTSCVTGSCSANHHRSSPPKVRQSQSATEPLDPQSRRGVSSVTWKTCDPAATLVAAED